MIIRLTVEDKDTHGSIFRDYNIVGDGNDIHWEESILEMIKIIKKRNKVLI